MTTAPTALVALSERREQVIALLSEQFGHDRIEVDELERRLELAHRATTVATLEALVADLAPAAAPVALVSTDRAPRGRVFAVFGGVDKRGRWVAARHLTVTAAFGGAELDFREAELGPGVTELHIRCAFGGVSLIVPPELAIESDAVAVFGGFEQVHRAPPSTDPDRPILRITGFAMFGGVEIETRLPGESRGDARRRAKGEAKALQGGRPAALPAATARIKSDD